MLLGQSPVKVVITIPGPMLCTEILLSKAQTELAFLGSGASVHSQAVQITPETSPRIYGTLSVNVCNRCFMYKGSGLGVHLFGLLFT